MKMSLKVNTNIGPKGVTTSQVFILFLKMVLATKANENLF